MDNAYSLKQESRYFFLALDSNIFSVSEWSIRCRNHMLRLSQPTHVRLVRQYLFPGHILLLYCKTIYLLSVCSVAKTPMAFVFVSISAGLIAGSIPINGIE